MIKTRDFSIIGIHKGEVMLYLLAGLVCIVLMLAVSYMGGLFTVMYFINRNKSYMPLWGLKLIRFYSDRLGLNICVDMHDIRNFMNRWDPMECSKEVNEFICSLEYRHLIPESAYTKYLDIFDKLNIIDWESVGKDSVHYSYLIDGIIKHKLWHKLPDEYCLSTYNHKVYEDLNISDFVSLWTKFSSIRRWLLIYYNFSTVTVIMDLLKLKILDVNDLHTIFNDNIYCSDAMKDFFEENT